MREIIKARGRSWNVGRTAGCHVDGFVHLPGGGCVSAEADTPEAALRGALLAAINTATHP